MNAQPTGEPESGPITSKEQLQAIIWRMRADTERLVAEAGPSRMELPGVAGHWSLKDVIAHLNGWRWWSVARMEAAVNGTEPTPPWSSDLDESTEENVDRINDEFYEKSRDRSVGEVLRESRETLDRLETALMQLSDEELFEEGRYSWLEGYPAGAVIVGSANHLFEDHERGMNFFLARNPGA